MFKTQINRLLLAVVLFNLCAVIGCHRGYYRRQADAEAQRLIRQKSVDPRWNTASGTIDIDPQSRMFDPFSADHPPIPPDDATSHQLMHRVDGKPGYPQWNANGDTNFVENPEWRRYLPVNEKGQVVLTLDRAYQLALIHSTEFQEARETLYFSALDVSLERFGFDTRMSWGLNSLFTAVNGGSALAGNGGWSLRKLGITGTEFAVGLANTILFNLGGGGNQQGTSIVNFSIMQPLLRDAGRDVIMESLTQSERSLLANVRQFERFRRGFYLQVAVGRNIAARLNLAGTFLGIPGNATVNAGGFFGLLEQQQQIRNQELNVRQLEAVLELFREYFLRDRIDAVQLKSFELNVYGQQRSLLEVRQNYQTQLDAFKRTLGLPPDLDVVVEDPYLDRFKLISDEVNERLILTNALREETGNVLNGIDKLFEGLISVDDIATGVFVWPSDLAEKIDELAPYIEQAESTLEKVVTEDREQLEQDFGVLDQKREARLAYLNKLKTAIESGKLDSPVDVRLFETESIPQTLELRMLLSDPDSKDSILNRAASVKQKLAVVKTRIAQFKQTESELDKTKLYDYVLKEFQGTIPGQLSELNNLVFDISLLQARTRSNSIEIIDVDIEATQAIEIARCMRRDWMNARASLVDNWRNIEFVADELESTVDLTLEGDIQSVGNHPFEFNYKPGQLTAGISFDAPIVRMAERNNYRAALISYQQTRRDFYEFEDAVKRNLREIKRNIDRNKILFELERRSVQTQIQSVEINRFDLVAPVGPGRPAELGPTAANQLASAIIGLNGAQNRFLGSWLGYEVLRRNLDFDLGTMQLDSRFDWVDPGQIDASIGVRAAALIGIELDCQFCTGVVAPGGIAANLISDPAPSVIEPQLDSLQFESEIPVPVEIERIDGSSAPQLNQPQSGIQQRRSILSGKSASKFPSSSRVPGLLFNPVKSEVELSVQRPAKGSPKQIQVQAKRDAVPVPAETVMKPPEKSAAAISKSAAAISSSLSISPDKGAESNQTRNEITPTAIEQNSPNPTQLPPFVPNQLSAIAQQPSSFQILPETRPLATPPSIEPVAAVLIPAMPADLLLADRIGDRFSDPLVKQTSSIEPTNRQQISTPLSATNATSPTLKAVVSGIRPIPPVDSTLSTGLVTAISPDSGLTNPLGSANSQMDANWQSQTSSLGGVLNRFRTVPEK